MSCGATFCGDGDTWGIQIAIFLDEELMLSVQLYTEHCTTFDVG